MTTLRPLPICSALALCLVLFAPSARATLVWNANFDSIDTSGGAVAQSATSSGANNTFTAFTPNGNTASAFQDVTSSGLPSGMTGNALHIGGTAITGGSTTSFSIQQSAITSLLANGGVLVLSYDLVIDPSGVSLTGEARTSSGRSGSSLTVSSGNSVNTLYRMTLVINQSGSAITLGDTAGTSLANAKSAIYRFDGTTYTAVSISATDLSASSAATGFQVGYSLGSGTVAGTGYGLYLDNFGAWSSLGDTVNGTSVLSLAPGTLVSAVPEPATTAALLGLFSMFGVVCFRRNRR